MGKKYILLWSCIDFFLFNANVFAAEAAAEAIEEGFSKKLEQMSNLQIEEGFSKRLEQMSNLHSATEIDSHAINSLVKSRLIVTEDCLDNLQTSAATPLTVDLLDGNNLAIVIKKAIDFVRNPENGPKDSRKNIPFIFCHYYLPEAIQNNPKLGKVLREISEALSDCTKDFLDMEKYLKKLYDIQPLLNRTYDLMAKDQSITEENSFAKFIYGCIKLINVFMAREMAQALLREVRPTAQSELLKSSNTTSIYFATSFNLFFVKTSVGANLKRRNGAGESSLYEITTQGGMSVKVSAGLKACIKAEVKAEANLNLAHRALFFSIEQMLDAGELKGHISKETFKKLFESRENLLDEEKELLRIVGNDVENFLKMISVIPINVHVFWPQITKTEEHMSALALSGDLSATAEVALDDLLKAGFKISGHTSYTTYKKSNSYLSLLDRDCSPVDNLTPEDITRIIGQQYDFSQTLLDSGSSTNIGVLVPIYVLLGDLRGYVSVLQDLAANKKKKNTTNIKELEDKKHKYESRFSPQHRIRSEGRLGVLKTCIATSTILRQYANTLEEIALFKKTFLELQKLTSLLLFSKDKKSRTGTFSQNTNKPYTCNGFSVSLLNTLFTLKADYSVVSDSAFLEENGKYISIEVETPVASLGSIVKEIIKKLNAIKATLNIKDALAEIICNGAIDTINWSGTLPNIEIKNVGIIPSVQGSTTISASFTQIEPNSEIDLHPLPGKESILRRTKPYWTRQNLANLVSVSMELKAGMPISPAVKVEGGVTYKIGKKVYNFGSGTLTYFLARFNMYQMGLNQDQKTDKVTAPWKSLTKNNDLALTEVFKNFAEEDSSVLYELQGLYNTNLQNISALEKTSGDQKKSICEKCEQVFKELLENCSKFVRNEISFEEVLETFEEVLIFNYQYNFLVHFNRTFSLHQEN